MADLCPVPTRFRELNKQGHLDAVKYAGLGPADPREPSTEFWAAKMEKWGVSEGVARTRLCLNCAHYKNDPETIECVINGQKLLASEVDPTWADISGEPAAVCTMWPITCSALRTCDDWEDPSMDEDNANVLFCGPKEDTEELQYVSELQKDVARMLKDVKP